MKKKTAKMIELKDVKKQQPKKYISKKRLARKRKFIAFTAVFLIVAITLTVLSYTVFFPIKKITINNTINYESQQLLTVIGVIKGDNLLASSESRANKVLKEKYPYVKNVDFNKKLPFTLEINVEEYQVFAQIKVGKKYYRINEECALLELTDKYKKGAPVVTGLDIKGNANVGETLPFDKEDAFENITKIVNAFKDNQFKNVTLLNLENPQDLRVTYDNRIVTLLGSSANLDKKLAHAKATLEARAKDDETGTLNLSRIPSEKNEASFIPRALENTEIAGK